MSGPAAVAVATGVLLDVALKATVVWGVAAGMARLSPSAAARHVAWAASFAALPVLGYASLSRGAAGAPPRRRPASRRWGLEPPPWGPPK